MATKKKVKIKVDAYTVISNALDSALESAMNKHDKYSSVSLSQESRQLLTNHLSNYFWCYVEENGIELEGL